MRTQNTGIRGTGNQISFSRLRDFADTHRIRTSTDDCGEVIIEGKQGQLYQYDDCHIGAMFMPEKHRPRLWGNFKQSALAAGMTLIQDGDSEGCLAFDACNKAQVKLALKIAGVKKRELSPERKAELAGYLEKARNSRSNPSVEGHLSG